ncbi:MAG: bifunctional proline dehydrogenase/L-glutamate gamma-semialdehyde dehydrogenase [Lentisphaerales bacterium]|nr:bifunctional proline dehydrogenase/L-glutamate gamma-semialdehyde dehydrogenase [Lentisphaerales bacterium]
MDLSQAQNIIDQVTGKRLDHSEHIELSIQLAKILIKIANEVQSREEYRQMAQLERLMRDPSGKQFTTSMTDECFRSNDNRRIANQIIHLLEVHGTPQYLDAITRLEMSTFKVMGEKFARFLIPMVKDLIRKETARVIIPGEDDVLREHLITRKNEGITTNLNHLGEAILGEGEAIQRLNTYIADLQKPEVQYISVKISTICSQLNLLAKQETFKTLKDRLRLLYREAIKNTFLDSAGKSKHKFVNLDMEEYRDLHLTVELFKDVLNEEEFLSYRGGIVLQAYLPDSFAALEGLTDWTIKRSNNGGAPIKIRLVKGANLAMEKVEASIKGWEQAPFSSKIEVDCHYRKMVNYALTKERAPVVNIGIASHNIFDISYALLLKYENDISEFVNFEMLEGMAEHLRLVIQELSHGIILYCPAAGKEEFQNAIAYLIRRLDENTADENFLRHLFDLKPNSLAFSDQTEFFKDGCQKIKDIDSTPRRLQNRLIEPEHLSSEKAFQNEADTDFSLPVNLKWAKGIYENLNQFETPVAPLVIAGTERHSQHTTSGCSPNSGKEFGKVHLASVEDIEEVLNHAETAFSNWSSSTSQERCNFLLNVAKQIRIKRISLISLMMLETGKTLTEADIEISEAIDFCEFYSRNLLEWESHKTLSFTPIGPVLVASPWNFPCAIPLGGIAAALITGNTVIFKPAPEASLVGWAVAQLFYEAGFSKSVLQFINCHDTPEGSLLIKDQRIKACILTGATDTAKLFKRLNPNLNLMAETGGKNCIVVTDMSDRDLAIQDIIHSAFGHAGQKCSACSLLILEENIYNDQKFLNTLVDATESLKVGLSTDPTTIINPLIHPPEGKLLKALTSLEAGEEWLLEPQQNELSSHLWSPGIKKGVTIGSFTFENEFFGPVLGIMRAYDLNHAMKIVNSLDYGLTGGIHSLDDREQSQWLNSVEVGNAYINRTITGAIVNRQPFGGYKNSAYGRGFKAGGSNYLLQFMNIVELNEPQNDSKEFKGKLEPIERHILTHFPELHDRWAASSTDYQNSFRNDFMIFNDSSNVLGQENYPLYKPYKNVRLFIQENDTPLEVLRVITACLICETHIEVFVSESGVSRIHLQNLHREEVQIFIHSPEKFPDYFLTDKEGRNRVIHHFPSEWSDIAAKKFAFVQSNPVFAIGRLELLHYLRAISVSDNFHRYGNLGNKKH